MAARRHGRCRAVALAAGLAVATAAMGASAQRVREEWAQPNIPSRLRPDDEIVVIRSRSQEEPLRVGEDSRRRFTTEIRELSDFFDATALVDTVHVGSRFVANDAWVVTDIRLRIVQTLRARDQWQARFRGRDEVSFTIEGGEITVGQVVVRAGDWPLFRVGQRYLVWLSVGRDGTVLPHQIFAVDQQGRITREATWSYLPRPYRSPLHGRTVDAVAQAMVDIK